MSGLSDFDPKRLLVISKVTLRLSDGISGGRLNELSPT